MPALDIYRLTFRDGLHVGRHGIGQENVLAHIPSDTLFAALTATRAQWKGDAEAWLEAIKPGDSFRLTSAFPFAGGVRFFPRPLLTPKGLDPKAWRKVKFVSPKILELLLTGELPESYHIQTMDKPKDGLGLQGGTLWLAASEKEDLPNSLLEKKDRKGKVYRLNLRAIQRQHVWVESIVPRVTVDRVSNTSEIFHTGRIQFAEGCGLWFGVDFRVPSLRTNVEETLSVLGDAGLGAERSAGYGSFIWQREENGLSLTEPKPDGRMVLLSRFHPKDQADADALLHADARYELVRVTGRTQTLGAANQRRRSVTLVAEGSVVGANANGAVAEVTPTVGNFPHSVYRYGYAIGMGLEK